MGYNSRENTMKKIISFLLALTMSVGMTHAADTPHNGALKGRFSVSTTKKVLFSKGNLQFNPSAGLRQVDEPGESGSYKQGQFRFAEEQWEVVGTANSGIASNCDLWFDLFGWMTSGYENAEPWLSSSDLASVDYQSVPGGNESIYDDSYIETKGDYRRYDWGWYNAITSDPNKLNAWRTMSDEEWLFLLNTRANAKRLRGLATVNDIPGLVLLPDNWNTSTNGVQDVTFVDDYSAQTSFDSNVYTVEEWNTLEAAGAVFLPCAGLRVGKTVGSIGSQGHYWTSTPWDATTAKIVYIDNMGVHIDKPAENYYTEPRRNGQSVRLVQDFDDKGLQDDIVKLDKTAYGSYTWHGYAYTQSGTYQYLGPLEAADGGDLREELVLHIGAGNVSYVCDFTKKASKFAGYKEDWEYDTDWLVYGGSNNNASWGYVKMGGKAESLATANPVWISNMAQFGRQVRTIQVYFEGLGVGCSLNKWGVTAYEKLGAQGDTLMKAGEPYTGGTKMLSIDVSDISYATYPTWQLYFDCKNEGTDNGVVKISKIEYVTAPDATGDLWLTQNMDVTLELRNYVNNQIKVTSDELAEFVKVTTNYDILNQTQTVRAGSEINIKIKDDIWYEYDATKSAQMTGAYSVGVTDKNFKHRPWNNSKTTYVACIDLNEIEVVATSNRTDDEKAKVSYGAYIGLGIGNGTGQKFTYYSAHSQTDWMLTLIESYMGMDYDEKGWVPTTLIRDNGYTAEEALAIVTSKASSETDEGLKAIYTALATPGTLLKFTADQLESLIQVVPIIDGKLEFTAVFEPSGYVPEVKWSVTTGSNAPGVVIEEYNGKSLIDITDGEYRRFQITTEPSEQYEFDHWEVNGVNKGADDMLVLTVNENLSVMAIYKEVQPANQVVAYECDFTTTKTGNTNYGTEWTYDDNWTVKGGANNNKGWTYVKFGPKQTDAVAYVRNKKAFGKEIKQIKVNFSSGSTNDNSTKILKEWGVNVYEDVTCQNLLYTVKGDEINGSEQVVRLFPEDGNPWLAGYGFEVYWDINNTTKNNGVINVNKIGYITDVDDPGDEWMKYTVSVSVEGKGEVTAQVAGATVALPAGVEAGKQIVLTAMPNEGYEFSTWKDGNTQNPRTLTVSRNEDLTAVFVKKTYTITFKDGNNQTLQTSQVGYGDFPVYNEAENGTPTKSAAGGKIYEWTGGWDKELVPATADATYTATFTESISSALDQVEYEGKAMKMLKDGELIIVLPNGTRFDATGTLVK